MKYERLTKETVGSFGYDLKDFEHKPKEFNDYDAFYAYKMAVKRLGELEDKIESGELISTVQAEQGEQEIAFFVEHNAEVRKQAIKEIEAAEDEVAKETEEILFIDVYNRLHEKGDYMGCVIVTEMAKERGVLWEEQE